MNEKNRPFLKWAGNKYRCLEPILAVFPTASRLIEPFTGSGAIFINCSYTNYLLAEGNPDLVRLFQLVQQEGESFIKYCSSFFVSANNNAEKYYILRSRFNATKNKRYKAALFLYLNRHGYNGLCRYNLSGQYNVPFGRYIKPYFPYKELVQFHRISQQAIFIQNDFRQTFALVQEGDVVYCDPPYVPLSASADFSCYTGKKFTEQDQIDLAILAKQTAQRGATVIISNHDTDFTRFHYQESQIFSFSVRRYISCKPEARHPVQELVAVFR